MLHAKVCIWSGTILVRYSLSPNRADNEKATSMQVAKILFQEAVKDLAKCYLRKEYPFQQRAQLLFIAVAISLKQGI